jgi:hypothetical protein
MLFPQHKESDLTPELTGELSIYQAFNLADEKQADSSPVV